MSLDRLESQARIEAALYASGKPLDPEELTRAGGLTSKSKAVEIARALAKEINSTLKAIEVVELSGHRFVMQLKSNYNRVARRFSNRPLVPGSILKTLSYLAYFQPIVSTELVTRRGNQAYQHLKILKDLGFISYEKTGRARHYRTTNAFSEYFGLPSDPRAMKQQLARRGIRELPTVA